MWPDTNRAASGLYHRLLRAFEDGKKDILKDPFPYETDVQVRLVNAHQQSPLESFWSGNDMVFIVEKAPIKEEEANHMEDVQPEETVISDLSEGENVGPLALTVGRARQLMALYTMAQNPNMTHLEISRPVSVLPPLWVRCDGTDPEGTCWLGAEPLKTKTGIAGIMFHIVTSTGPVADKSCSVKLEDLKKRHKKRHHSSAVATRGFARYELFRSTALDDTISASESSIMLDMSWSPVDEILQIPLLTSAATLNIKVESGDPRSLLYHLHRELKFLLVLAGGLKTGITEWPEPLEAKPAIELVQDLLTDLKNKLDGFVTSGKKEAEEVKCDTAAVDESIKWLFMERGDLDFAEQLWCKMRKSIASYQDLVKCFTLVIQALKCGEIQPWLHSGSSSLLGKLIQQSYHGAMDVVSLSGSTPIQMLLEIGLDKIKKDYINCFIGQELASLNHLEYFITSAVDIQEQVHRVQKLHHMLEVVISCTVLLKLKHEILFPLTQSCLKYYQQNPLNEQHLFQLPIRPTAVKKFYQSESPQTWRVEVSSGPGQEVKTIWQLSDNPPVEHLNFSKQDLSESTFNSNIEERMYFTTTANCSQVYFT
ncbi:protein zwilch homolog [Tachyglossus aculeatus]|uniref:protein zwilch homolog n=1 Tax=Tachyglossus aculeatus TaxID=9261 RepID=UPI0018F531C5|nr:protein zwilch homolog [Tachyglossus aculeatus]